MPRGRTTHDVTRPGAASPTCRRRMSIRQGQAHAGQFEATKAVGETLAAVSELRKRIVEVPTWPWRPQVLSGFISALLVPVAVYLLTRAVAAQIGP